MYVGANKHVRHLLSNICLVISAREYAYATGLADQPSYPSHVAVFTHGLLAPALPPKSFLEGVEEILLTGQQACNDLLMSPPTLSSPLAPFSLLFTLHLIPRPSPFLAPPFSVPINLR